MIGRGITRGPEGKRTRGTEGHRELAPGFRRLKAERLTPEWLTAVAVTRHLKLCLRHKKAPVSGG